ncbi:hypothetical protein VTK26DRAFT_4234 [Humicola hyalothermophila]
MESIEFAHDAQAASGKRKTPIKGTQNHRPAPCAQSIYHGCSCGYLIPIPDKRMSNRTLTFSAPSSLSLLSSPSILAFPLQILTSLPLPSQSTTRPTRTGLDISSSLSLATFPPTPHPLRFFPLLHHLFPAFAPAAAAPGTTASRLPMGVLLSSWLLPHLTHLPPVSRGCWIWAPVTGQTKARFE